MRLHAIIVEDEPKNREMLSMMITKYCPQITSHAIVDSIASARKLLAESDDIHMAFLDVQFPDGSGLDLLNDFKMHAIAVIFTTAYKTYALDAVQAGASGYLLKPISVEELIAAVDKAAKQVRESKESLLRSEIEELKQLLNHQKNLPKKIAIHCSSGIHLLKVDEIVHCKADDSYTHLYLVDGTSIVSSHTLKIHEAQLKDHAFFRPHRSHLVNLHFIKSYTKGKSAEMILENGTEISISKDKLPELMIELRKTGFIH